MEKKCRNFKTKFWAWIMIFTLVLGGGTYGTSISVKADIIVYVTPTGSKYHTHACGRGNYQPSTLSAAKARGLTPCSKCFPNGAPSGNSSKGTHKKTVTKVTKVKVKPIKINKKTMFLLKGKTGKLKVKNATSKVKWISTKTAVAKVSDSGKVTAKKAGKTTIIAKVGSQKKQCKVTVEDPKLNKGNISLLVGQSSKVKIKGCKHHVKWITSDSDVVRVKKGKIKAVETGRAKVIAKVHGKKIKCSVLVKKPKISSISLTETNIIMNQSEIHTLYIKNVTPNKWYEYYATKWTVADKSIVQIINDMGDLVDIQAVGVGQTDVYINIGGKVAKCHVVVK
jgi:hypothetical protein